MLSPAKRIAYFSDILDSAKLEKVSAEDFEMEFSRYIGVDNSILVPSGGFAIDVILRVLETNFAAKIAMPALTCRIVPNIAGRLANPNLVEIDPENYNINLSMVGEKVKYILPVHLYGNPCEISTVGKIVIEDACHALGAEIRGRKAGSFGEVSFFSLRKNLAVGTGGVVCTNNKELAEKIRALAKERQEKKPLLTDIYFRINRTLKFLSPHNFIFYRFYRWNRSRTYRLFKENALTDLEISIAFEQLKKVDEINSKAIENARYLDEKLKPLVDAGKIKLLSERNGIKNIYTRYPILFSNEVNLEKISLALRVRGFDTGMLYNKEFEENCKNFNARLPITESVAKRLLPIALPPTFGKDDLDEIAKIVGDFVGSG